MTWSEFSLWYRSPSYLGPCAKVGVTCSSDQDHTSRPLPSAFAATTKRLLHRGGEAPVHPLQPLRRGNAHVIKFPFHCSLV